MRTMQDRVESCKRRNADDPRTARGLPALCRDEESRPEREDHELTLLQVLRDLAEKQLLQLLLLKTKQLRQSELLGLLQKLHAPQERLRRYKRGA